MSHDDLIDHARQGEPPLGEFERRQLEAAQEKRSSVSHYRPARGFPDWTDPATPPEGEDAGKPIRWLCAGERGLFIVRDRSKVSGGAIIGWRIDV